jgi:hypothetical protein
MFTAVKVLAETLVRDVGASSAFEVINVYPPMD